MPPQRKPSGRQTAFRGDYRSGVDLVARGLFWLFRSAALEHRGRDQSGAALEPAGTSGCGRSHFADRNELEHSTRSISDSRLSMRLEPRSGQAGYVRLLHVWTQVEQHGSALSLASLQPLGPVQPRLFQKGHRWAELFSPERGSWVDSAGTGWDRWARDSAPRWN